jgi:fatty-acyl-CoA synthase
MPGATYIERLVARLAAAGAAPVLRHAGRDIEARDLLAAIHRQARALASLGIGRGSLVALLAPNTPPALTVRYAANLLGAGTVYLSVPPLPGNRAALLAQMAPSLLVAFPETAALLPPGGTVPVAGFGVAIPGAARLDQLAEGLSGEPLPCAARPEDLGVIVSSGGTTGVPHGSWRSFAAYDALIAAPDLPGRRQLVNGRLAYLSQALVDGTLLGGGSVVLRDGFDAADTIETIERERITHLFLVEPQLFEVMDHPDVARRDISSLRQLVHIGASAPPVLRRRARERLGPVIAHTYGASDMGLVSMLPAEAHDPARPALFATAGPVMPGVELRLRRPDGGLAAPGEAGMVEVRSASVAGGYRNRPAEEAAAFSGGWFRSGDLARLDDGGLLHILGRAADIVEVDGVMITPTMIEDVLCRVPDVRCASVVAQAAERRWVAACVAWDQGRIAAGRCRAALAAAFGAVVAEAVVIVEADRLPMTEQGKPDRAAIVALCR